MASTSLVTSGGATNMTKTAFTVKAAGDNGETSSLSPFALGLFLEAGILAVALGNLLVLLSLKFQKQWVITDILLLSLSAADFIGGAVPLQIVVFMNYFAQRRWTPFLCGFYILLVNALRFASAGTVTLIAVERAFMILSPFKYHTTITTSRMKKLVMFTWLNAVMFASLPFLGVGKSGYEDGKCFYHLTDLGKAYAILIVSASFVLLALVLACYFAIKSSSTQFIKRQTVMDTKNKSAGTNMSRGSVSEEHGQEQVKKRRKSSTHGVREIQRLSLMMALVVFLYYISWLPILISNIVTLITGRQSSKTVVLLTGMVSLIYALANPIIYGKMSCRYRWAYRRLFESLFLCETCRQRSRSWSISFSRRSTRSRTLSLQQISSDHELDRNITKGEGPGYPKRAHGRHHDTAGQRNEGLQCQDGFAEGVVLGFGDDGNSSSQNEFMSRDTNSSYLSNEFLS